MYSCRDILGKAMILLIKMFVPLIDLFLVYAIKRVINIFGIFFDI